MKHIPVLLTATLLPGCGLQAEAYLGPGETLIIPLSLGDVAPLVALCTATILLLLQAPITAWRSARRRRRSLRSAAFSWYGFTMGLSQIPLCLALHDDTFHPSFAGPFNFGKAMFVFQLTTIPLMLAGFLLVGLVTLCRWLYLRRRRASQRAASTIACRGSLS